jgi:hypothetical protein
MLCDTFNKLMDPPRKAWNKNFIILNLPVTKETTHGFVDAESWKVKSKRVMYGLQVGISL